MALTKKQRKTAYEIRWPLCVLRAVNCRRKDGMPTINAQAELRKSEQCMKAAEKRIFRLKSTGDVFRPEADCPKTRSSPVRRATR